MSLSDIEEFQRKLRRPEKKKDDAADIRRWLYNMHVMRDPLLGHISPGHALYDLKSHSVALESMYQACVWYLGRSVSYALFARIVKGDKRLQDRCKMRWDMGWYGGKKSRVHVIFPPGYRLPGGL